MCKLSVLFNCCSLVATGSLLISCDSTDSLSQKNGSGKSNNGTDFRPEGEEIPSGLCNGPSKAQIYPYEEFKTKGKQIKYYDSKKNGDCMKLAEGEAESINTKDTCVRIYKSSNCTPDFAVMAPGTESHNRVRNLFLSRQLPRSIGPCD